MSNAMEGARLLPTLQFEGTTFYVDTRLHEFREHDAPWNRISMDHLQETGKTLSFLYDTQTKNVYVNEVESEQHLPAHVKIVSIPPLIQLDPVGLARKYGLPDHDLLPKPTPARKRIKHKRRGL